MGEDCRLLSSSLCSFLHSRHLVPRYEHFAQKIPNHKYNSRTIRRNAFWNSRRERENIPNFRRDRNLSGTLILVSHNDERWR
jgi:hypothetical protein